jgi:hypothetical protein
MPIKGTRKEEREVDRKKNSKGKGIKNIGGYKEMRREWREMRDR